MTGMRPVPPAAVRVTGRGLIPAIPCRAAVIALPRPATNLAVAHQVACRGCDRPWAVCFLAAHPPRAACLLDRPDVTRAAPALIVCSACHRRKPPTAFFVIRGPLSAGDWLAQPCADCCQARVAAVASAAAPRGR